MPEPIKRLSEAHRLTFELIYQKGYDNDRVFGVIASKYEGISYGKFRDIVDEINATLGAGRIGIFVRWRNRRPTSLDEDEEAEHTDYGTHDKRTPEAALIECEDRKTIQKSKNAVTEGMASLSDQEQMVVNLSFWLGLKPRQIAESIGMEAKAVSRLKALAIDKLRKYLQKQGFSLGELMEAMSNLDIL
jgi:RNA polymerase sigma factor (sigma-70 family)